MEKPHIIDESSFQEAWLAASMHLSRTGWEAYNLVVTIGDVTAFDPTFHNRICAFCKAHKLLGPKDTAYTIFPHNLYKLVKTGDKLYFEYNRERGLYPRLIRRSNNKWGTYFRRMTHYDYGDTPINQLQNIISAINSRENIKKAAYTIIIQKPGRETVRPMGAPCLNYIAVQMQEGNPRRMGLLCVYRNQYFLERAYGNYWGLCNLLRFLATETNTSVGPLTCISSHAIVTNHKVSFGQLLDTL